MARNSGEILGLVGLGRARLPSTTHLRAPTCILGLGTWWWRLSCSPDGAVLRLAPEPSTPTSRICCLWGGSLPCPPSLPPAQPTSPKTTSSQLMRGPADAVFLPPQELWGTCIWCRDNVSLAYLTWHATVWQECNLWATLLRHLRSPLTTNDMLRALLTLTLDHL